MYFVIAVILSVTINVEISHFILQILICYIGGVILISPQMIVSFVVAPKRIQRLAILLFARFRCAL
jgi:hypothetical protein